MRKTHFHLATSLVGLLAFILFLSGCSSGDDPETPPDKLITVEIPATQTSLLFNQEGGTASINLTVNGEWKTEMNASSASWLSVSPTSGNAGIPVLTVTAKENLQKEKRVGTLTISAEMSSKSVTISQEGNVPAIKLSQYEYTMKNSGGRIQVEVRSNIDYSIVLPDDGWIVQENARAFTSNTYTFSIQNNDSYNTRTAEILFVNQEFGVTATLKVIQAQTNVITVGQDKYEVNAEGGLLKLHVKANVNFKVTTSDQWIVYNNARALTEYPLLFTISPNGQKEKRTAVITLAADGITRTITVTQCGATIPESDGIDNMPVEKW